MLVKTGHSGVLILDAEELRELEFVLGQELYITRMYAEQSINSEIGRRLGILTSVYGKVKEENRD